jgi:hypothetical protein
VDAARLASSSISGRKVAHSLIPLTLHQTWKNTDVDTWPESLRANTEKWLEYVVSDNMVYLLWDDTGISLFLEAYERDYLDQISVLSAVERTDVFRILVSKWLGGIVKTLCLPTCPVMFFWHRILMLPDSLVCRYGYSPPPTTSNLGYAFRP